MSWFVEFRTSTPEIAKHVMVEKSQHMPSLPASLVQAISALLTGLPDGENTVVHVKTTGHLDTGRLRSNFEITVELEHLELSKPSPPT